MPSSSQEQNVQSPYGSNGMQTTQEPPYMLHQYINADATIVERTSGSAQGSQSATMKYREYISKAHKEIEKFDKAWGGK